MSSPTPTSNAAYARSLLARKRELDHVPLAEALARRIEVAAEALMAPEVAERSTHLGHPRAFLSDGHMCLSGVTRNLGQPYSIRAQISFCESRKASILSLATMAILGKERFCRLMARRLRDALARKEAFTIHSARGELPEGASREVASPYAAELLAAKAELDQKPLPVVLSARITSLCQSRMRAALDAGLTHLAIGDSSLDRGELTIRAHCATGSVANAYGLRTTLVLQPAGLVHSLAILAFATLIGRERFCSLAANRICSRFASLEADALHERGAELPPGVLALTERKALDSELAGSPPCAPKAAHRL